MQEQVNLNASQRCICEILHLNCRHGLRICECTFCRVKAAPRHSSSIYGRITASQIAAITRLANTKQRSLPANISSWSVEFASRYIKFLISLSYPRKETPRFPQELDFQFAEARRKKFGEYYWNDGMTRPVNQAIEKNDSLELSHGITAKEAENVAHA